jgi:BA14K-like protein
MASSFAVVSDVTPYATSALRMVLAPNAASFARSAALHRSNARRLVFGLLRVPSSSFDDEMGLDGALADDPTGARRQCNSQSALSSIPSESNGFSRPTPQMNRNLGLQLANSLSEFGTEFMKDMQAHAKKIRSDAAECLMLSNLVTEERRPLFAKIAEHLNSLALEIETETATSIDPPITPPQSPVDVVRATPAGGLPRATRSWHQFSLSFLVALVAVAGIIFWEMNRMEMQSFSSANLLAKTELASGDSYQKLAAMLSDEKRDREIISDQLSTLNTRFDGLVKELDDLKSLRTASIAPSVKATVGQNEPLPGAELKTSAAEEKTVGTDTSNTSSSARPTAPGATGVQPAIVNVAGEANEQVGTIAPTRADLDPHKLANGPAGCTHFRSFDPISGTYTTFDGRRRPCR